MGSWNPCGSFGGLSSLRFGQDPPRAVAMHDTMLAMHFKPTKLNMVDKEV